MMNAQPSPVAPPAAPDVARRTARPWTLLAQALGSPTEVADKLSRFARGLWAFRGGAELDRRLARLHSLGIIERVPNRIQLVVGGLDMLRFWISPAASDYYAQQGISFTFHQILRFLDDPVSMTDPVGFFSTRDAIIGHLMQVVHANPDYDLQLLEMYDDGVAELEGQLEQMLAGTHPRAASISAVVEEAAYHGRLLDYVRRWRAGDRGPSLLRSNVAADAALGRIERTFGTLTGAMRYFCKLPSTPIGGALHLARVRSFPFELAGE